MKRIIGALSAGLFSATMALAQDDGLQIEGGDDSLTAAPQTLPEGSEVGNNTAFGDWLVNCEAVTTTRVACSLLQELSLAETDQLIVRFIVVPADDDAAILLAQVPMGAYLPGGAVFRLDDEDEDVEQRSMIWQRCLGALCEAALRLDADELFRFDENEQLLFGYRPALEADPIVVGVDISQFNTALEAIRGGM
ncbi:invasion associated locus B family protein [Yoonia sp.]|uniref:invasion associated locus B family protein n=1 Tax=Yoonia sp. TaxID=2212373 RepID=UPI00391DFC9F